MQKLGNNLKLFQSLDNNNSDMQYKYVGTVLEKSFESLWACLQAKKLNGFRRYTLVHKFWYLIPQTSPAAHKLCKEFFGQAFVSTRTHQPPIGLQCFSLGILTRIVAHLPAYMKNHKYSCVNPAWK